MRFDLTLGSAMAVLSTLSLLGGAAQAQDTGDFVADGPTASRPADPFANSVSSPAAALTNRTPDYFEATYPHLLRAPLPARIYKQGGIPPVIDPWRCPPIPTVGWAPTCPAERSIPLETPSSFP